jgi:hypothetical protein
MIKLRRQIFPVYVVDPPPSVRIEINMHLQINLDPLFPEIFLDFPDPQGAIVKD